MSGMAAATQLFLMLLLCACAIVENFVAIEARSIGRFSSGEQLWASSDHNVQLPVEVAGRKIRRQTLRTYPNIHHWVPKPGWQKHQDLPPCVKRPSPFPPPPSAGTNVGLHPPPVPPPPPPPPAGTYVGMHPPPVPLPPPPPPPASTYVGMHLSPPPCL